MQFLVPPKGAWGVNAWKEYLESLRERLSTYIHVGSTKKNKFMNGTSGGSHETSTICAKHATVNPTWNNASNWLSLALVCVRVSLYFFMCLSLCPVSVPLSVCPLYFCVSLYFCMCVIVLYLFLCHICRYVWVMCMYKSFFFMDTYVVRVLSTYVHQTVSINLLLLLYLLHIPTPFPVNLGGRCMQFGNSAGNFGGWTMGISAAVRAWYGGRTVDIGCIFTKFHADCL